MGLSEVHRRRERAGSTSGSRGGGLVRTLGGWSQVLSLSGNKQKTTQDTRVLGSGDFVTEILKEADKNLKRQLRLRERQDLIERMIKEMCEEEGIEEQELRNGGRRGNNFPGEGDNSLSIGP
jgi:putative transposase